MALAEPVIQLAPSFPGLLDTMWNFAVAWLIKYWYVVVILGVLWYSRQYRIIDQETPGEPPIGASFLALQRTFEHVGQVVTQTSVRLFVMLVLALSGAAWLLQGIGTIIMGAAGLEPVMTGNLVVVLLSGAAALFPATVEPWMVGAGFVAVVAIIWFVRLANVRAEKEMGR